VKEKNSWTKAKVSNLYRHDSSGIYYARTKVNGVDRWATMETDVFSVAQARLPKKLAELIAAPENAYWSLPNAR
jgi:hypothetical protein